MDYLFPLRPDINVSFSDVPRDLTKEEAHRIMVFIESLALPQPESEKPTPEKNEWKPSPGFNGGPTIR